MTIVGHAARIAATARSAFVVFSLVALLATAGGRPAGALTIDLEGIAPPGGQAGFVSATIPQSGFEIGIPVSGSVVDSGFFLVGSFYADNGSDWLLYNSASPLTLSRTGGTPFSIQSFDATFWGIPNNFDGSNGNIAVTGHLDGGGTLSQTFTVDTNPAFETFLFGPAWANLASVEFQNVQGRIAFDNFVVDEAVAAVPEPAALAVLGLGLAGLARFGRRRG